MSKGSSPLFNKVNLITPSAGAPNLAAQEDAGTGVLIDNGGVNILTNGTSRMLFGVTGDTTIYVHSDIMSFANILTSSSLYGSHLLMGNGTIDAPSITFDGDHGMGMFKHQDNVLGFSIGSALKATISDIDFWSAGTLLVGYGSFGASPDGKVAIGKSIGTEALEIVGNINMSGNIQLKNAGFLSTLSTAALTANRAITLPNANVDLGYTPTQYVNLTSTPQFAKIGIAQAAGTEALEVAGNIKATGSLFSMHDIEMKQGGDGIAAALYIRTNTDTAALEQAAFAYAAEGGNYFGDAQKGDICVRATQNTSTLRLGKSSGQSTVRITDKVGINQNPGTEALEVAGNIKATGGMIIVAPDSTSVSDPFLNFKNAAGFGIFADVIGIPNYGSQFNFKGKHYNGGGGILDNVPVLGLDMRGRVGIAQAAGVEALEVAGNIKATGIITSNGQAITGGTFTTYFNGPWSGARMFTFYWSKVGNIVTLGCNDVYAGDGVVTTGIYGDGFPADIRPATAKNPIIPFIVNGVAVLGIARVCDGWDLTIGYPNFAGIAANTGLNGFRGAFSYCCV